jgi:hypothetical protein
MKMMNKLKFDTARYCKSNAGRMGRWQSQDVAGLIGEEVEALKEAIAQEEQYTAGLTQKNRALAEELAALQDAVRWERECSRASISRAILHARPWAIGEFCVTESAARAAVDALIAEGK